MGLIDFPLTTSSASLTLLTFKEKKTNENLSSYFGVNTNFTH